MRNRLLPEKVRKRLLPDCLDNRVRSEDARHYFDLCRYVIGLRLVGYRVGLIACVTMAKQSTVKEILWHHGTLWRRPGGSMIWNGRYRITEQIRSLFPLIRRSFRFR